MQKDVFYFISFLILTFLIGWYVIAYSFYDIAVDDQKKEFVSDGCTLFRRDDLHQCCVVHDRAYWEGGSSISRRNADLKFKECVQGISQNTMLSQGMYVAVRLGGSPYIKTPWRWGFGWEYGRGYR